MKKIVLTCIMVMAIGSLAHAEDFARVNSGQDFHLMKKKAKRGIINLATGVFEIPKQIKGEMQDAKEASLPVKPLYFLGGAFKGIAYAAGRTGSGLWDLVTFNLAIPKGYAPLMKPEYVCEHMGKEKAAATKAPVEAPAAAAATKVETATPPVVGAGTANTTK